MSDVTILRRGGRVMASRRRIEAYERKLAKIATEGKPLDADCLMAVATVHDFHEEDERTGVLVWFSQEVAQGTGKGTDPDEPALPA